MTTSGSELERFARALRASGTRRVHKAALWQAFAQAFPHRPSGPDERHFLLSALRTLEDQGVVRLPPRHGKRWDRALHPALPESIELMDLVAGPMPTESDWRGFPWHPRLQWVSDMRSLSKNQHAFLHRVHKGLVEGWFARSAPIKYRSLQLTGDEKRLSGLMKTQLFAPGCLDLELLGCFADHPPLSWESVAPVDTPRSGHLLVFENAGPFMLARGLLRQGPGLPYGLIAYGSGRTLPAALPYLKTIARDVVQIHYVGDLDPLGMEIALDARERAAALGLPHVQPAPGFHRAMLHAAAAFDHPLGWKSRKSHEHTRAVEQLVEFLPENVRETAQEVFRLGNRVPEEVLGPDEMREALSRVRLRHPGG